MTIEGLDGKTEMLYCGKVGAETIFKSTLKYLRICMELDFGKLEYCTCIFLKRTQIYAG